MSLFFPNGFTAFGKQYGAVVPQKKSTPAPQSETPVTDRYEHYEPLYNYEPDVECSGSG